MGFLDWLKGLFTPPEPNRAEVAPGWRRSGLERGERRPPGRRKAPSGPPVRLPEASAPRFGLDELARRLGRTRSELDAVIVSYRPFTVPKRGGGARQILAPAKGLKDLQRAILRRLLARLPAHPAAHGFERGRSIVTNARPHARAAVVVRLDLADFFTTTRSERVEAYFRLVGWDAEAARRLAAWTTHEGGLPQGAPTSPRLANLVNCALDARLAGLAAKLGAVYTRYADDLTFSFGEDSHLANDLIHLAKRILAEYGYRLHMKKKLSIRRPHQRQVVTGLVVNDRPRLPRDVRRRLRAAEHRLAVGGRATLTPEQLAGWRALERMIEAQGGAAP